MAKCVILKMGHWCEDAR